MIETIIRTPLAWHNMTDDEMWREISNAAPELADALLARQEMEIEAATERGRNHAYAEGYASGKEDERIRIAGRLRDLANELEP